jgi:rubrerythrin
MAEGKRFQRRKEDFVCEFCGANVKGTGYTDHCPSCLCSKHVDNNPGDRLSDCGGKMNAISAEYKSGQFMISYRCVVCGKLSRIRSGAEDNADTLISLAAPRK